MDDWSIQYTNVSHLDCDTIELSCVVWNQIHTPSQKFYADPFLVFEKDEPWIFFEEYSFEIGKGCLSCAKLSDLHNIRKVDIQQKHHVSYPNMFVYENNWYLIPETCHMNQIVLYKCVSFPDKWKREAIIQDKVHAGDSTFLTYKGLLYIFTAIQKGPIAELRIFWNTCLTEPWKMHAINNHESNMAASNVERPAGNFFIDAKDRLIRPAQQNRQYYGSGVVLQHVTELSPTTFAEVPLRVLAPQSLGPKVGGFHTFNYANGMLCVDKKYNTEQIQQTEMDELKYILGLDRSRSVDASSPIQLSRK